MRILDAAATAALLPYPSLVDALRSMLVARERDDVTVPQRMAVPLPADGTLLVMPASSPTLSLVKVVTVHPNNEPAQTPRVQADLLVLDARTGRRLYLLDGDTVTACRTAALSLLAAQTLGAVRGGPLLIVGAGVQARSHLHAFVEGFGVGEVYIVARSLAHARHLADEAHARWGVIAHPLTEPTMALPHAPLIITATTSAHPVLPYDVRQDAFIAAVGAYRPTMAELPPELVRTCSLYVDTLNGARAEAGDLIQAGVDWTQVTPLAHVMERAPRQHNGPVIFKSVGDAAWDLAAATVVHETFQQEQTLD